jgi:hypothetical protein
MLEGKIVQFEPDVFMGIDFGDDGRTAVYCQMRKLPDGTFLVEEFGRLLDHDARTLPKGKGEGHAASIGIPIDE